MWWLFVCLCGGEHSSNIYNRYTVTKYSLVSKSCKKCIAIELKINQLSRSLLVICLISWLSFPSTMYHSHFIVRCLSCHLLSGGKKVKVPSSCHRVWNLPLWNSRPVTRIEFQFWVKDPALFDFFAETGSRRTVVGCFPQSDPPLPPPSWCKKLSVIHQCRVRTNLSTPPSLLSLLLLPLHPGPSPSPPTAVAVATTSLPRYEAGGLGGGGCSRGREFYLPRTCAHAHTHHPPPPFFSRGVIEALNPSVSFFVVVVVRQNKSRQSSIRA